MRRCAPSTTSWSPSSAARVRNFAITIAAALAPTAALAHPGDHHLTVAQAFDHLLSQADHQLAFAGLVVAMVTGGWFWVRAVARK